MHHLCRQLLFKEYKQSDAIYMKYKHDKEDILSLSLLEATFVVFWVLITFTDNSLNPNQFEPRSGLAESPSESFEALADSVPEWFF